MMLNEANKIKNAKIKYHLVDERYELVSLIFRLAGHEMYQGKKIRYQRKLNRVFDYLKNHKAVEYAKTNLQNMSGDIIWFFAIHLAKVDNKFIAIDNMKHMLNEMQRMKSIFHELSEMQKMPLWIKENTAEFIKLVNDFYVDSKFMNFFPANKKYYHKHSSRFMRYVLDGISYEWFKQFGLEPNRMKIVLSPSMPQIYAFGGYEFQENKKKRAIYALLPCQIPPFHYEIYRATVVHEFSHAFTNDIAETLYNENDTFRKWCDETVNPERLPQYAAHGLTMACECITRAYTILYFVENENKDSSYITKSFSQEKNNGFPYIEQVYALITKKHIKTDIADNYRPGKRGGFRLFFLKFSTILTVRFITQVLIAWIAVILFLFFFASNHVLFRQFASLPIIFAVLAVIEYRRKRRPYK